MDGGARRLFQPEATRIDHSAHMSSSAHGARPSHLPVDDGLRPSRGDGDARRTLFRELVRVVGSMALRQRWMQYLTGTAMQMALVMQSPEMASAPAPTCLQRFAPDYRMQAADMLRLLQHYWKVPAAVAADPAVTQCLQGFEGRPVFYERVWVATYNEVRERQKFPTASEWCAALGSTRRALVTEWQDRMQIKLDSSRSLAHDSVGTRDGLLPRMLDMLLLRGGDLDLSATPLQLEEAMCTGFLAVSTSRRTVSARDDPISLDALRGVAIGEANRSRLLDILVRSSRAAEVESTGQLTARALSWHWALLAIRSKGGLSILDALASLG
jgi:hypothetical protein